MKKIIVLLSVFIVAAAVSNAADFKPLWNGKSLAGWHIIDKGDWKIESGAIHGTHVKTEKSFGHLVTDRVYRNFVARLKFKALKGNSGLYFRIEEKGHSGVSGFQAEIDAKQDVGGLYETNGRGWVVKPDPEKVKTWFKPGEWNEMEVIANGGDITVLVNGKKSAELKNDPGRAEGRIALQLHANLDCDMWFKDLEISEL